MKKILAITAVIGTVAIAAAIYFYNPDQLRPDHPAGKTVYYTRISQTEAKQDQNNRYEYKVTAYSEQGKEKTLSFTTGIKLNQGAIIMLYDAPLRGVTYWQEVKRSEVPVQVGLEEK
ncbi:YxeA family protein [Paenibacillus sp. GCM10027626]|uniref:YxeA family protein n=1 Tax=Paenibacillus sp. GCM10027626 TaxID=3273411 RepID=UPI00364597E8